MGWKIGWNKSPYDIFERLWYSDEQDFWNKINWLVDLIKYNQSWKMCDKPVCFLIFLLLIIEKDKCEISNKNK